MDAVLVDGVPRSLGLIPTPPSTIARMHREGSLKFSHDHPHLASTRVPESTWVESDCAHFWKYRKYQSSQSACVGFSGSHAMDIGYAKMGFDLNTSPAAIYSMINGGRDAGASMGDCLEALQKYGVFLSGSHDITDLDWKTAYRTRFWSNPSSSLGMEAMQHRVVESVFCSSLDDFLNGLQTGQWSGQFGLGVGNNFEPDANGWLPPWDGAGINHALCATGGMKKNPKTGKWGIQGANSWGDWGPFNGIFWCEAENWLDRSGQELWLLRSATVFE